MHKECPICGRPFSLLDIVLIGSNAGFQCHHCWNRIHATGPAAPAFYGATAEVEFVPWGTC